MIERVTMPAGKLGLEGLLEQPDDAAPWGGAVVCHPHPLYGGNMHNNVVQRVTPALAQAGLAALRFNFRGVGRSQGTHGDGVGEQDGATVLSSAELHDPAAGTVTLLSATLGSPRRGHTATLLTSGEVLIAGGEDAAGNPLPSVEVFDPKTAAFRAHPAALGVARSGHAATLLPDGRVLYLGGRTTGGTPPPTAEVYDPGTGTFTALVDLQLPEGRTDHTATLLPTGEILVAGGRTAAGPTGSSVIAALSPVATRPFVSLAGPRAGHTATLLPGGTILLAGGEGTAVLVSAEKFVPAVADTTPPKKLPENRPVSSVIAPAVPGRVEAPLRAEAIPADGASGIPSGTRISLRFSEPVDPRTLTPASLASTGPSGDVSGTLSAGENGLVAFLTPTSPLAAGVRYAITLNADIRDMAGNPLSPTTMLFTTQPTAPIISAIVPPTVPQGSTITVTISGQNLNGATGITNLKDGVADGQVAASITNSSPTSLTATIAAASGVPVGPRTLIITAPQGESSRESTPFNTFSVVPAPPSGPVIVSFDRASGLVGATLTIQGRGFGATAGENLVTFAGVTPPRAPAPVDSASTTQLVVRVPSGARSGPVTVQVGGATSNGFQFIVEGTQAGEIVGPIDAITLSGSPTGTAIHQGLGLGVVARQAAAVATLVDLATRRPLTDLAVGGQPSAVGVSQGLNQAFVANAASANLTRVNLLQPPAILGAISLTGIAGDLAVSEGPPLLFVVQPATNSVTVLDAPSGAPFGTVQVGLSPSGIALDVPVGVWVANAGSNSLSIFSPLPPFAPIGTVALPGAPGKIATHSLLRLGVVTQPQANQVVLVDLNARQVVATLPVGTTPRGVVVSPQGQKALVTNVGGNTVSVIDLLSRSVIATVPVGQGPTGVAVHEASQIAVVTNATDGTATFIDLNPPQPAPTITTFTPTSGPAGTLVTITGTGFDASAGGSTVTFASTLGRIIAPIVSASPTQLVAQVPEGPKTGPVGVANRTGTALSTANFLVTGNPLRIRITSPADGAAIAADRVDVVGSLDLSTATVGVTVNGVPAQVSGDTFIVSNVPLQFAGPTVLTATAVDELGTQAAAMSTVQGTADPPGATLTALPLSGEAPLAVAFSLRLEGTATIRTFEMDFEGDGIVDQTFTDQFPPSVPFTYAREGVYHPTVTMTDAAGRQFSASTVVLVDDPATITARFQARWNSFKDRLGAGDIPGALAHLTPTLQPRFQGTFQQLAPDLPAIAAGLGEVQVTGQVGNIAEGVVVQNVNGTAYLRFIYFRRAVSGQWFIEEM